MRGPPSLTALSPGHWVSSPLDEEGANPEDTLLLPRGHTDGVRTEMPGCRILQHQTLYCNKSAHYVPDTGQKPLAEATVVFF